METKAQVHAQFSMDSTFVDDLAQFMSNSRRPEVQESLIRLSLIWGSDQLDNIEREELTIASNTMAKVRMRPYPDFYYYIETISNLVERQKKDEFENWRKELFSLLNQERISISKVRDFIEFSFFLTNEKMLNKTSAIAWYFTGSEYTLSFDDKSGLTTSIKDQTIYCQQANDSIVINKTSGIYNYRKKSWSGKNGMVTWERVGLVPQAVNAKLNNYQINMKKSGFKADSVFFINRNFFPDELEGKLEHSLEIVKKSMISYPRFESYTKHFEMKNVLEQVDYSGGLSMQGARMIGTGNEDKKAQLFINKKDTLFILASSRRFIFEQNEVHSSDVEISMYLEKDSIYHPSVSLKLSNTNITLLRDISGFLISPFLDSYHNLEINTDQIEWERGSPYVYMSSAPGASQGAKYTSTNYFTIELYEKIQMRDREHPLAVVYRFAKKNGSNEFETQQLSDFMHMPLYSVRQMLTRLSYQGFVTYNATTEEVVVKPKTRNYLLARVGKQDYDVLEIKSSHGVSGELFLDSLNLKINGANNIELSRKGNVYIYSNDFVNVKKNREIFFTGDLMAGTFLFSGENMVFNYDSFKVDMPKIHKIQLAVIEKDSLKRTIAIPIKSIIENSKGTLYIDKPSNKAGIKNYNNYPIFDSPDTSYVYYDKVGLDAGVYSRDKFHFDIYPFTLDSLNSLKDTHARFYGELNSGGIVPIVQDTLARQITDNSLGFIRRTNGILLYGGKGMFDKRMKLSNRGLGGDGVVKYQNVTMFSNDFAFFPDSMVAITQQFDIERFNEPKFTNISGDSIAVSWVPINDTLCATNLDQKFFAFDSIARINGQIIHTPDTLMASGTVDFYHSQLQSDSLYLFSDSIFAQVSNFKMFNNDTAKAEYLIADSIQSNVDFVLNEAYFTPKHELAKVYFPQNQFMAQLNEYTWKIDSNKVDLGIKYEIPVDSIDFFDAFSLPGAKFISTHPNQDSLTIIAATANLLLDKNLLKLNEVNKISVADALIYPSSTVYIHSDADIDTLFNSRISADTTKFHHQFFNATTKIKSRTNYFAKADYNYLDENDSIQNIFFHKIYIGDSINTIAEANIIRKQKFKLSPQFAFEGKIRLDAAKKHLFFDGYTRIANNCEKTKSIDFKFENRINPDTIYIPVSDSIYNLNNEKIHASIMLSISDSMHIYPAFFNYHKRYSDKEIVAGKGLLTYDKDEASFKIAEKQKLDSMELPINIMRYTPDLCELSANGKITLTDLLNDISFETVGKIDHNRIDYKTNAEVMLTSNFFFNKKALDYITSEINKDLLLEEIPITSEKVTKRLDYLMGHPEVVDYLARLSLEGNMAKLPEALDKTFVFSDIEMKWNNTTHSFQSVGKIGVMAIGGMAVNKYMEGYVELIRSYQQDILNIYLIYNDDSWVFFSYSAGVLKTLASDETFNSIIEALKSKERVLKPKRGQEFSYDLASIIAKERFLRQFKTEDNPFINKTDNNNDENITRTQTDTIRNNEEVQHEEELFEELIEELPPVNNSEKKETNTEAITTGENKSTVDPKTEEEKKKVEEEKKKLEEEKKKKETEPEEIIEYEEEEEGGF